MSYPNIAWLSRLNNAGPIASRTIGKYRLFAVGVPIPGDQRKAYWGSVNAVALNRFADDCESIIIHFDAATFESAEAAATNALDGAEAVIGELQFAASAKVTAQVMSKARVVR